MRQFDRSKFDHIGIVTTQKQPRESWVEATRVWVTSPRDHPYNVEFLRFAPDTPVTGPLRTEPHVAYRVDDLERALEGHEIVLEPFDASGTGSPRSRSCRSAARSSSSCSTQTQTRRDGSRLDRARSCRSYCGPSPSPIDPPIDRQLRPVPRPSVRLCLTLIFLPGPA
jgi:hypothetical protein